MPLALMLGNSLVSGSGTSRPIDPDAVAFAAQATTMTAANVRLLSDWYKSLKGEAGYWEQLDTNVYDDMVEGWALRGDFNLVTGDEDDAMSTALGMKLTHSLTPNALYWGDRGTRFFTGATNRVLATSAALLANSSEWSMFAVLASNSYAAQIGIVGCHNSGAGAAGRTTHGFISSGGVFGSFSNNGASSVQSFTNINSWGYEPRSLMAVQSATQIKIYDNGSETAPSPQALVPGTIEQTPFRIGNIGTGSQQFNGTIYDLLLFNAEISGANNAKMHRNYNRIFGAGLKDSGTLKRLPDRNYTSQVTVAAPGTTGLPNYLGTPSLIQQGDNLIASCDHFGSGTTAKTDFLTSTDLGATWTATKTEAGMFWGGFLDIGDGALYMLGTAQENGNLVIKKSVDAGLNWTTTTILTGLYATTDRSYLIKGGYLYTVIERVDNSGTVVGVGRPRWTFVLKVDITTDLMTAGNWTISNELDIGDIRETIDATATSGTTYETLEHNIYEQSDGSVVILGRTIGFGSKGSTFSYDTSTDTLACTGGDTSAIFAFCKSGQVRCPTTGKYLVIGNKKHNDAKTTQDDRTALWWFVSETGESGSWAPLVVISDLGHQNLQEEGLQYPSQPVIIGDDIYFTVRAAWNGANDYHNANRILFWRVQNYVTSLGI